MLGNNYFNIFLTYKTKKIILNKYLIINAFSRATRITRTLRGDIENLFNIALLGRFDRLTGLIAAERALFEELNQARIAIEHAPGAFC